MLSAEGVCVLDAYFVLFKHHFQCDTARCAATMPLLKVNETRAAIAAAESVFPEWRKHTAKERSNILKRCRWRTDEA